MARVSAGKGAISRKSDTTNFMKTGITVFCFIVLAVLHQDFWNWNNRDLVFGFIPVGLFYHSLYSVVAAIFWFLVSRLAWPHRTEAWADEAPAADK